MMGWWNGILGAAIAATCGCCCALAQDGRSKIVCGGETVVNATVSHIIDGRTFVLNDGREVRLAAIEVPPLPPPGYSALVPDKSGQLTASDRDAAERKGKAAKDALDALIGGDQVALRQADISLPNNLDRYGRVVAYAYAMRDGEELFAQGDIDSAGFARVGDRSGTRVAPRNSWPGKCRPDRAKLGLWGDPYYDVLDAEAPRMCWRGEANLRWSRARCCPCVKRGHDIREFWAAVVRGLYGYDPEAKRA